MSPTIGIIVLIFGLIILAVCWYLDHVERFNDGPTFKTWVKNPGWKEFVEQQDNEVTISDDLSDQQIRKMVEDLFVEEEGELSFQQLQLVGERAVPFLLTALDDPRTSTVMFGESCFPLGPSSPFKRISRLLDPWKPAEAIERYNDILKLDDPHFRQWAALSLGNIGRRGCVSGVLKALQDEDFRVGASARAGIANGLLDEERDPEFLDPVFDFLAQSFSGDPEVTTFRTMLAIERERALEILNAREYLTDDSELFFDILRILNKEEIPIPHRILLPLIEDFESQPDFEDQGSDYAKLLTALGIHPDDRADERFDRNSKSQNPRIRAAAARARALAVGIRDPYLDLAEKESADLTQCERVYLAVCSYKSEVDNGGHAQYFVNSSGDSWKTALEGLRAMGDLARADILFEATRLFGSDGPPEENMLRHRKLAKFSNRKDRRLAELDSRFYALDKQTQLDEFLWPYLMQNREQFRDSKN